MLASLMQYMYLDKEWIVPLMRGKAGAWEKKNAEKALKCWNLERVIEADLFGKSAPKELTSEKFMDDEAQKQSSGSKEVVVVD